MFLYKIILVMKFTPLEKTQLAYGLDYLKIFDGSSKYSDLKGTITGTHNKKSVTIAGNQMYVAFETTSTVVKKFMAAILENGNISLVSKEYCTGKLVIFFCAYS